MNYKLQSKEYTKVHVLKFEHFSLSVVVRT